MMHHNNKAGLSTHSMLLALSICLATMPACDGTKTQPITELTQSQPEEQTRAAVSSKPSAIPAMITIESIAAFNKEVLNAQKPVIAKFSAKWCGACKVMAPNFEAVAQELGNRYIFVTVDIDKTENIAKKYNIQGVPAILFFKKGDDGKNKELQAFTLKNMIVGVVSKEELKKKITAAF